MGWDVVQIGLRHNLPVEDPIATAQEVAKRMKRNIRLVYRNEYEYDIETNTVYRVRGHEYIELGRFKVTDSESYLQMLVSNYQANLIVEKIGYENLKKAKFEDEDAELILDDLEDPFEMYEIEDVDTRDDYIYIRIFKENVDLDVTVIERWTGWEHAFHTDEWPEGAEWLREYRMKIYDRAKMFGCNEVIICSDQGPTIMIHGAMNYSANDLKEYALSCKFHEDSTWLESEDIESWRENAQQITFSSFFQNEVLLTEEDFVEVIYDDFKDLESVD